MGTGKTKRTRRAHSKKKGFKKYFLATKHCQKDLDQIQKEVHSKKVMNYVGHISAREGVHEYDEDLPGSGQFYCPETGRYFVSAKALADHKKTKAYKKRLKVLQSKIYSQEEADEAAGLTKEALPPAKEVRARIESGGNS